MTGEEQIDSEQFELRLPLWAIADVEGCICACGSELHGPFLDLFTGKDIAEGYIRKAGLTKWQTVELATAAQVPAAVVVLCKLWEGLYVGLDCTGPRDGSGRFFTNRQFLALMDRTS
jgi:hypothetical protein